MFKLFLLAKKSKSDLIAILSLFLTWLIFFSRTITAQLVYYLDDLKIIYFPLEWTYAQFQREAQLPLWSNLFGFGHPLLSWGQLGFFTPLHLFLRALSIPPLALLQISILTYFFLGSLGMFFFLRNRKLMPAAAALGSLVFTYSGFHIGHLNHVNFYTATMLLPWLLLSINWLIHHPSLKPSLAAAIIAAAMALSGQPQIVLYSFIIAALWFLIMFFIEGKHSQTLTSQPLNQNKLSPRKFALSLKNKWFRLRLWRRSNRIKVVAFLILSGLLAFSLGSFAILPLAEFLPSTERANGLSQTELLEFSYPPHHAITLLLPYFFGDHNYYWGAKSFQELAAFTGIIPLLLLGSAFLKFKQHRPLIVLGLFLVIGGITFALGQYSPIYTKLVTAHLITSLSIPGRFVFFFVFGMALLSAVGLHNITTSLPGGKKMFSLLLTVLTITITLLPFAFYTASSSQSYHRLIHYINFSSPYLPLIVLGLLTWSTLIFFSYHPLWSTRLSYAILFSAALTFIIYGWNYNPLTDRQTAFTPSPFQDILQPTNSSSNIPPRLYQVESASISARRRTDPISPSFTVYQPIITQNYPLSCFSLPYRQVDQTNTNSPLRISLIKQINSPPLRTLIVDPQGLPKSKFTFCFNELTNTSHNSYLLAFSSSGNSGIRLTYRPTTDPDQRAYFIRLNNPSPNQIKRSQKPVSILFDQLHPSQVDTESQKLARHLNVTANSSSANWIGALAIKPYRSFVAALLDDDFDPGNYNSASLIANRRSIIDLAGITDLIELSTPDADNSYLTKNNFKLQSTVNSNQYTLNLYHNPTAYPKAFLVPNGIFSPVDDETIYAIKQPSFSPRETVYISGPTPPQQNNQLSATFTGSASLNHYDNTTVNIETRTNQPTWLVVTDATTPQWHTYIDGQPAPYYIADTVFKAAQVPAGHHTITWRYESRAAIITKYLTTIALLITIILTILCFLSPSPNSLSQTQH